MTRRILLLLPFLVGSAAPSLQGQQLSLVDIDASSFPTLRGKILLVDASGAYMHGIDRSSLRMVDNGGPVDPATIALACPPPSTALPVSLVMVLDRSGSMSEGMPRGGGTRIEAVRSAASALIQAISFTPSTGVAITAFDAVPGVISDFRATPQPLLTSLAALVPSGPTDYNPPYLDPLIGAFALLRNRAPAVPRVVVFVSDGEPTVPVNVDSIVAGAQEAAVTIHTVTLGTTASSDVRAIAEQTGGRSFDNIEDAEGLRGLLRLLGIESQGIEPCALTWAPPVACVHPGMRQVIASIDTPSVSAHGIYRQPDGTTPRLVFSPSYADLGIVVTPNSVDIRFVLQSMLGAFTINDGDIPGDTAFEIVDWGGSPPPFTIDTGESRAITVRCSPPDSAVHVASLVIDATPCSPPLIPLVAGATTPTRGLTLVSPRGRETFSGCDPIDIRWRGVSADTPVDIDWSSDNGVTWRVVVRGATGLVHSWLPPDRGNLFRIRITSRNGALDTITRVAGGGAAQTDTLALRMEFRSPVGVWVDEGSMYTVEAGRHRVRRIDIATGMTTTIGGTGSNGFSGDGGPGAAARLANPNDIVGEGPHIYVADFTNNRVRRIDQSTGVITTVAGTGLSGYSGDGGPATSAQFFYPSQLAIWKGELYITDRGNLRIRRMNLVTGRVVTIVGGGSNPQGDGGPANAVILTLPSGITVADDTLFVSEEGGHRIRAVSLATGMITTIAGTGEQGFQGDGGPAESARLNQPIGLTTIDRFLVIADKGNNRLRMIDRYTRRITTIAGGNRAGFDGDDGDARDALLDGPQGVASRNGALYVADANNEWIRRIALPDLNTRDSSTAPFVVERPALRVDPARATIAFGPRSVGGAGDTLLPALICNAGGVAAALEHVAIIGRDSADFQILSGLEGPLAPGECRSVMIRFRPRAVGQRIAFFAVGSPCLGYDTLVLRGPAIPPCGGRATPRVDLGVLDVGSPHDSTILAALCNQGASTISGVISIVDNGGDFRIVSGGGPFSLQPGACLAVRIRFIPGDNGRRTGTLDFGLPDECEPARTLLFGVGRRQATLSAPSSLLFRPQLCYGASVDTSLTLVNSGDVDAVITRAFISPAASGVTLIEAPPDSGNSWSIAPGETRSIRIRFNSDAIGSASARLDLSGPSIDPISIDIRARRDSVRIALSDVRLVFDAGIGGSSPVDVDTLRLVNSGTVHVLVTDASLLGVMGIFFRLIAPSPPFVVNAGDTIPLVVAADSVNNGNPRSTTLLISSEPSCGNALEAELLQEGNVGLVRITPVDSLFLFCRTVERLETTVEICNPTRTPLTIDSLWLEGDGAPYYTTTAMGPLAVGPLTCITIPIRFAPTTRGFYPATLRLRHEGAGDSSLPLNGLREPIDMAIDEDSIALGAFPVGTPVQWRLHVRNSGDRRGPVSAFLDNRFPPVGAVTYPVIDSLDPGEVQTVTVEFTPQTPGTVAGFFHAGTSACPEIDSCWLTVNVVAPFRTVLRLPIDSAPPGTRVTLPIFSPTLPISSLRAAGIDSFRIEVYFDGTILWPRAAVGANTIIRPLAIDGTQSMTIAGPLPQQGDTVTRIVCDVLSGTRKKTALSFAGVEWMGGIAWTDTIDGSFVRLDGCGPDELATRPRLDRVRPKPARDEIVVDVWMPTTTDASLTLVDNSGVPWRVVRLGRIAAGTYTEVLDVGDLPSGTYWLIVETPFGKDHTMFIVTR